MCGFFFLFFCCLSSLSFLSTTQGTIVYLSNVFHNICNRLLFLSLLNMLSYHCHVILFLPLVTWWVFAVNYSQSLEKMIHWPHSDTHEWLSSRSLSPSTIDDVQWMKKKRKANVKVKLISYIELWARFYWWLFLSSLLSLSPFDSLFALDSQPWRWSS